MIPSIETIIEDLLEGKISKSQAITWLLQHAEDAGRWLRDDLAMAALTGIMSQPTTPPSVSLIARAAYHQADAMLEARASRGNE